MNRLGPIQEKYQTFVDDPATLDTILQESTDRARQIAATTMDRVRKAVGIG